jgi:hypothetical protein
LEQAVEAKFTRSSKCLPRSARTRGRPDYEETVLSCLHTILEEEWEHLRFAVRDLDEVESQSRA